MMAKNILDDLRCEGCTKKLSKKQKLYETAWCGVYWCGKPKCAYKIMLNQCDGDELDADDPCNQEY